MVVHGDKVWEVRFLRSVEILSSGDSGSVCGSVTMCECDCVCERDYVCECV